MATHEADPPSTMTTESLTQYQQTGDQNQSQSNKRMCAVCTKCGNQVAPGEPRLHQWANRNTQRAYVHDQCITGGIGRDHEHVRKVPADNDARDTVIRHRDSVLSAAAAAEVVIHTTTAPRRPPTTTTDYSTGRKLFATMTRFWIFNGSTRFHGPKSKTCGEPFSFNSRRDAGLPCNRRSMPSYEPLCTTDPHPPNLNQHGRSVSSAVGSSWAGRRRTRRIPTAPTSCKRAWNSSGPKNGLHCGPQSEPNAT